MSRPKLVDAADIIFPSLRPEIHVDIINDGEPRSSAGVLLVKDMLVDLKESTYGASRID